MKKGFKDSKEILKSSYLKTPTIENYLDRIRLKERGTVRNVKSNLVRFDRYLKTTYDKSSEVVLNEILGLSIEKQERSLYEIIQDYVNHLSSLDNHLGKSIAPLYVKHAVGIIRGYLRYFGFRITSEDVKGNIVLSKIIEEEREPLTRESIQLIINNQTGLRRAMYLVMSSSGMRIGETLQIRKRDLDFDSYERVMIKLPAKITKTKKARITFISKEAEKELLRYVKNTNDDSFVFNPENRKLGGITINESKIFGRLREKLALDSKYESGVSKVSLSGSFRSWFVSRCNRVDFGFGHALAGHDLYMKRYDRITVEEKVELYLKSEKTLQAFDYLDEDKINEINTEYKRKFENLERNMANIQEHLEHLERLKKD